MLIAELNGTDFCKRLRNNKKTQIEDISLLIVFLRRDAEKCLKADTNDFMNKAFDIDDLISKVRVNME